MRCQACSTVATAAPARHIAQGDFNGDGLKDIVTCPSYFTAKPKMACEFWLNRGGGWFSLGDLDVNGDLDMAVCELGGKDRSGVFLLINGSYVDFVVFLRVVRQLP